MVPRIRTPAPFSAKLLVSCMPSLKNQPDTRSSLATPPIMTPYQDPNTMKPARHQEQKPTEFIFADPQILNLQRQRQLQAAPIMPGDLYAQPDNPRPPKLPPRQVPVYRQVEKPNVSTPCIIIMCVLVETLHVNEYCNTLCPNAKC